MRSFSLGFLISLAAAAAPAQAADPQLGQSVQANIAAMTVNLNPSYANVVMEGSDGIVAEDAIMRYRNGQVRPLIPMSGKSELGSQFATGTARQARGADGVGAQRQGGPN